MPSLRKKEVVAMLTEHDIDTKKSLHSKPRASLGNSMEARRDCFNECVEDGYSEVECATECGFPIKEEFKR